MLVTMVVASGPAQAAGNPPHPAAPAHSFHEAKEAGRWSLLIAAIALVFVLPFLLWVVQLLAQAIGRKPVGAPVVMGWIRGAIVGTDKRLSSSKTVAVIWTYAVASALLSIVIAKWWGHGGAYAAQVKNGLQSGYGLLIGGPLGAAILAKGIVTSQVAKGQSKPTSTAGAKVSDLVNNDQGSTDLGDLQYVLFNTVALTFFFGEFLSAPQQGLPTIPNVLLGLTSISAVGYVGKKVLPAQARTITKLDPSQLAAQAWQAGVSLKVLGSNLLNADGTAPAVSIGDVNATQVLASTTDEGLVLDVDVPANTLAPGKYEAVVVTAEGNKIVKKDALTLT